MRLLDALVAVGFFVATCSAEATTVKFSIAAHCPSSKIGVWDGHIYKSTVAGSDVIALTSGTTSDNFVFVELKAEVGITTMSFDLWINIFGDCETQERLEGYVEKFPIKDDEGLHYGFRVFNLENEKDKTDSEAYKYLFMKYLEKDCAMNECKESSRDYVAKGCDFFKNETSECMKGYDDTLPKYCQKEGSSAHSLCSEYISTTSSTKMILIIGGAVGAIIVLVLAIGVFFYCRKKKKSKQNLTGTMSGSTAASGTTGAPTRAPTTTGAATTTGTQRY